MIVADQGSKCVCHSSWLVALSLQMLIDQGIGKLRLTENLKVNSNQVDVAVIRLAKARHNLTY